MKWMRMTFAVIFTLVIVHWSLVISSAAELSPTDTAVLLQKLKEHRAKFPSLTADFTEEKTTHLLTKPLVAQGTIAFQTPNKFRRELKGNTPSITVTDGAKLWIYYPSFKTAELYTLGQRQFFDDSIAALIAGLHFERIADYYRYRAFREGEGYRLALTPKSSGLNAWSRNSLCGWTMTSKSRKPKRACRKTTASRPPIAISVPRRYQPALSNLHHPAGRKFHSRSASEFARESRLHPTPDA